MCVCVCVCVCVWPLRDSVGAVVPTGLLPCAAYVQRVGTSAEAGVTVGAACPVALLWCACASLLRVACVPG
jgi:hypothetical protein